MASRLLSRAEHTVDGIVHVAGVASSVIAFSILLLVYLPHGTWAMDIALVVYALAAIGLFCASAAYHLVPNARLKPLLQRFDHAAIHFKIAGTYTPLVVMIGGLYAYAILAVVWVGAGAGAILRLAFGDRFDRLSIPIYLMLGWTSVALTWMMFERLPLGAAILVVVGGLLYTVGVLFHVWERLRFQKAIWHGFVLSASSCHFTAVTWGSFHMLT
jgi:hemolysin III